MEKHCHKRKLHWWINTSSSVPYITQKDGTANRESYNLAKGKRFQHSGLELKGRQSLFSSLGWLMTVSEDANVIKLLHPLNRTQIKLPKNNEFKHIRSFCLSASPSLTLDFVVMVLGFDYWTHWRSGQLAFCRAKDNKWTRVDTWGNEIDMYVDLTYYQEQFYVLDVQGRVLVCDIEDRKKAKMRVVVPQIPWDIRRTPSSVDETKLHLVKSAGTLLVVIAERSRLGFHRNMVKVFEVPFSKRDWTYSEVKNLGNRTLFLNDSGYSFSIEAYNYSHIKSNRVYYSSILCNLDKGVVSNMSIFTVDEIRDPMSCLWIQPSF
ncbi:hypothetical protein ACLB2K_025826 [Fragaria x ananassa]